MDQLDLELEKKSNNDQAPSEEAKEDYAQKSMQRMVLGEIQ